MTRKEVAELARSEERWRMEVLWRLDSLTWTARQLTQLLQYLRDAKAGAGTGRKTELGRGL